MNPDFACGGRPLVHPVRPGTRFSPTLACMDVDRIAAETGWALHHLARARSTNDEAAALVAAGAGPRTAVVADRQSAGRGREGRRFASPAGGLYVSLLLAAHRRDLPGPMVALVALAAAEAIEERTAAAVAIKWPNDLWIERRKVGGILLESSDARGPVIAGIGINVRAVPEDLPAEVRAATGALSAFSVQPVDPAGLLCALLMGVDRLQDRRAKAGGAAANEAGWRRRLALIGEEIVCRHGGAELRGVLEDVSLRDGLLIRAADSGPVWRRAEHVQDLTSAPRTIS